MDVPIRLLTLALLVLPPLFLAIALLGNRLLLGPTALLVAIYVWIWLWFRPTRFSVQPRVLEIVWPLRRREIPRDDITTVRLLDKRQLRSEEHTSELQSRPHLVCRLLLEKKKHRCQ